jgi:hypothetical protein
MTIQKSKLNIEDIKVGETYNVRVKVIGIAKNFVDVIYVDDEGISGLHIGKRRAGILRPISPEKNTEPSPKYDSFRKFRKGDIVEPEKVNGRLPKTLMECYRYKVLTDEEKNGDFLQVKLAPSLSKGTSVYCEFFADVSYLRLVIPVEEREPYSVGGSIDGCILYKNGEHYAEFVNSIDAERACKLLNAEHIKKMGK